jgi:hypothetical protein
MIHLLIVIIAKNSRVFFTQNLRLAKNSTCTVLLNTEPLQLAYAQFLKRKLL